ncbi:MAG: 50S ribosomal protein L3 [Acidobacteriota bacterium]
MQGILGKKLGMTQIFQDNGRAVPVTVVQAGPCRVVQRKTADNDGYDAVQVGLVEDDTPNQVNSPMSGHFKKAGVEPARFLAEFHVEADAELAAGDEYKASIFAEDDYVDVIGTSKGKGFQGVIKRHGFGGGRATHGSMFHRAPGSIGQSAYPSRVFPGVRLPGQMGAARITTKNLLVVKVDEERNLIYLRGSVPGSRGGYIAIQRAKRG